MGMGARVPILVLDLTTCVVIGTDLVCPDRDDGTCNVLMPMPLTANGRTIDRAQYFQELTEHVQPPARLS